VFTSYSLVSLNPRTNLTFLTVFTSRYPLLSVEPHCSVTGLERVQDVIRVGK
jgi:hypothetical protein